MTRTFLTGASPARRWFGALTASVLALAGLALPVVLATAGNAVPVDRVVPSANPDLAVSCGLDVVLVIDASNSINTAGATQQVKNAATNFLSSFRDTNTRVGIVRFNTTATAAVPLTLDTTVSMTGNGVHAAAVAAYKPSGSTNWQDALVKAKAEFDAAPARPAPRLVVFITDGAPNEYNGEAGTMRVPDADAAAVDPAVTAMNALKATGAHALGVGIGQVLDGVQDAPFRDALARVTQYPTPRTSPDSPFDVARTDLILQPDLDALQADLRAVASQVCDGSLALTQYASSASAPDTYASGGSGWSYVSTVSPAGDWVKPVTTSVPSLQIGTDSGGTALSQWDPGYMGWSKTVSVAIVPRPNYSLTGVTCTVNGAAIPAPVLTAGTFSVTVGSGKSVACALKSMWTGPLATRITASTNHARLTASSAATLTGAMSGPRGGVAHVPVSVDQRTVGTTAWHRLKLVQTGVGGRFSQRIAPGRTTEYRVWFAGSSAQAKAASKNVRVGVAPRISLKLKASSIAFGSSARFSGSVSPKLAGSKVLLQRYVHGKWVTYRSAKLSRKSAYVFVVTPKSHVDYRWRVVRTADSTHLQGRSTAHRLTVR